MTKESSAALAARGFPFVRKGSKFGKGLCRFCRFPKKVSIKVVAHMD